MAVSPFQEIADQLRIGRNHTWGSQVGGLALLVHDDAAGFLNQDVARGDVPRRKGVVEVEVHPVGSGVGNSQG